MSSFSICWEMVLHALVIVATKKSSININRSSNNFPDEDPLVIGQGRRHRSILQGIFS